jgi:hypothetical protein
MPERLRLSYRVRLPDGARSVARPHRWGNQFAVGRPYALGDDRDCAGWRGYPPR